MRIEVAAAGINFADVMARMGLYPDAPKTPCVVGYEVAGTVLELGEGVEGLTHGQRVLAGTQFGGYASQVVVPAADVVALPDGLTFEQGAAIPVNYATAWAGADRLRHLQAGRARADPLRGRRRRHRRHPDRQAQGAEVYGHGLARQARAHPRAGRGPRARLHERRAGSAACRPFDVILDAIGGKSFRTSYSLLRPGGRLVAFGASAVVSGERRNVVTALRRRGRACRAST